jgi:hypothetical protein
MTGRVALGHGSRGRRPHRIHVSLGLVQSQPQVIDPSIAALLVTSAIAFVIKLF